ncbi:hypothetical protein [Pseudaestuariivita sp.]
MRDADIHQLATTWFRAWLAVILLLLCAALIIGGTITLLGMIL